MRLRVATLNVWGLPEPITQEPGARLRAIGRTLPELALDVVAFQEAWYPKARRILREAGDRAGLVHAWSPEARFGGSGLLVLSRHPIERARFAPYALGGLPQRVSHGDYYGGKGYVNLRIATPEGPVAFVDTHLHARYAGDVPHAYMGHRSGQVVQLALGTLHLAEPLVVVGDFNFVPGSAEDRVLRGLSGLRDLAQEAGDAEPTVLRSNVFRAGSTKPDRRVDFVFGRDGRHDRVRSVSARRVFDSPIPGRDLAPSNHAGVLAELEIGRDPTLAGTPWHPAPEAIESARQLLAGGRGRARERRSDQRALAGAGLGLASLVAIGDRRVARVRASRRGFLRAGLQATAAAALAPSLGCSLLSEVFAPDELRAYDTLTRALDQLALAQGS